MKIKIITYNIHKGFNLGNFLFTLKEIKNALSGTNSDIVFLQEVQGSIKGKRISTWRTSAQFEYLADTLWDHYSYGKNSAYTNGDHGNATLTKFPILSSDNIDLTINRFEKRGLLHTKIKLLPDNKILHLLNTHINLLESSRLEQALLISNYIKKIIPKDEPYILAGDFNDWSHNVSDFLINELEIKEAYSQIHQSYAKSFPSYFPILSLDRIFYKNLMLESSELLHEDKWKRLSDHLPLCAEFKLLID